MSSDAALLHLPASSVELIFAITGIDSINV
jgi:hypothetical protein